MATDKTQITTADQRIDCRVSAETKELIERAAAIEGISVSAFVIGNAVAAARQVVAEHQAWILNRKDSRAFVDALLNPMEPSAAL